MRFILTKHAQTEIIRRRIPDVLVDQVSKFPEQIVKEHGDIVCHQSKIQLEGKPYLIRVMINPTNDPAQIVTVYKTSKIGKYWSMQ